MRKKEEVKAKGNRNRMTVFAKIRTAVRPNWAYAELATVRLASRTNSARPATQVTAAVQLTCSILQQEMFREGRVTSPA